MVAYHHRRCSLYAFACIHRLRSYTTLLLRSFAIVNDCTSSYTARRNTIVIWSHVIRRNTVGYVPFVERLHPYTVVYGLRNPRPGFFFESNYLSVSFLFVPSVRQSSIENKNRGLRFFGSGGDGQFVIKNKVQCFL